MRLEKEGSGGFDVLRLEGECTIERAYELKALLVEALGRGVDLQVDVEAVEEVDLTCLQLLCSAHRAFLKSERELRLRGDAPACFRDLVRQAGYSRTAGCFRDSGISCLWERK